MAIQSAGLQATDSHINRWWHVVGGVSMNLALGSLYGWSVFVAPLEKEFHWKRADTSNVFIIAVVVFALSFIVAGRLQDKLGPFKISLTGAILVSIGFLPVPTPTASPNSSFSLAFWAVWAMDSDTPLRFR